MGTSVIVNRDNFETEVLAKSQEKLVLVDFYATWCGPCQMLKPMLEKLAEEYDFVLAKVDIDANPDLAQTYGVQGVPDVRLVRQGEVREGFVGVLPEAELRQLLTQFDLQSDLTTGLATTRTLIAAGNLKQAKDLFGELLEKFPGDRTVLIEAAKFLVRVNQLDAVDKILAPIQEDDREHFAIAKAVKAIAQLKRDSSLPAETETDELYIQASRLTLEENYEAALELFLELVSKNRRYRDDAGRKAMLTIFDLLGSDHPLTKDYRKRLMLTLY